MNLESKIYVAGHRGMVGSGIVRKLRAEGYQSIITRLSSQVDLRNQQAVFNFFETEKPDYVFLAAAKVGGIMANNIYRADFLYDNLMIESNIIHAAYKNNITKLLFLGSSCIYPKMAPQPLKEEYLLTGLLEETNEPYAIAKIAGIKLCEAYRDQYGCNFISAMPTNLYGQGDNYHPDNSHVLPALLRKFHEAVQHDASQVEVWGSGTPLREFMYVDDLADACVYLMNNYNEKGFVNVGTGEEVTIAELAKKIAQVTGFSGKILFNTDKPDGTPRKLMDSSRLEKLGWKSGISLEEGLTKAYQFYQQETAEKSSYSIEASFGNNTLFIMADKVAKEFRPNLLHPFYFIRNGLYKGIQKHAPQLTGDVLDFGCGAKPYKNLFTHCRSYVGVDYDGGGHEHTNEEIDFYYDGKTLPFCDAQFDGVFSSEVFEHLFTPADILPEINRVLKMGAKLLITCPFVWPEHEKPYDYARYTLFALTDMLQKQGFKIIATDKCGNFFIAIHQLQTLFVYQYVCGKFSLNNRLPFLATLMRKILIPVMNMGGLIGNAILPSNKDFYLNNILLAEKVK